MLGSVLKDARVGVFLFLLGLVATVSVLMLPFDRTSGQTRNGKKGLIQRTSTADDGIAPDYDIRTDKDEKAVSRLLEFRSTLQKTASDVADVRDEIVRGEQAFKAAHPNSVVEYNKEMHTAAVMGPNAGRQTFEWLTGRSKMARKDILVAFPKQNSSLVGVNDSQIDSLKVLADYTNPAGNLSFVHLEQEINGYPVFRGEIKAGFNVDNQIVRVINNLAPGLDYKSLSMDFGDPTAAVRIASQDINHAIKPYEEAPNYADSTDKKTVFGSGDFATTAEKMYFPTEPGVAVPAWRVLIYQDVSSYYVIVDAKTGTVLWHKNITDDQTQSATYNVYSNSNAFINVADSPFPLSPGPLNPTLGQQGAALGRNMVTLIGNEPPNTFNNLGWITDGNNTTDGNNVQAGLDRKLPNTGSPANPNDLDPDGMATGTSRVFNFPLIPGDPSTNSGDSPLPAGQSPGTCLGSADASLPTNYQKAAVTNLFYIVNRYHDKMYQLGFTEAAFNFQNTNFTPQGLGGDRVSAQAQDCSGSNNANFTTPADGSRPTMQMYLWTGPTPDFDGDLDAEVIIHEHTHGLSNRLHGNSTGLSNNMSRGMGEGWGDFYGYAMLAEPTDSIDSVYTTGGYVTYLISAGFTGNYYYGIRRFPRAPITLLGPNGKPHNPYTFQYVNNNCNTLIGTTTSGPNSAYPRGPVGSSTCDQVHNLGEIWSSALWEVRNRMVTRLGFTAGTNRVLQVVTDGMKLAPTGPTFLQERDAIITAAAALPFAPEAVADVKDIRNGFAVRGMGTSASIQNAGSGANNTAVTEAFDGANANFTNPYSVSDSTGDNDGFPEPNENLLISVPITNNSGVTVNNVVASITGGGSQNYGSINDGQTVTRQISYHVPSNALCGSDHTVNITGMSSEGALNPSSFTFRLGMPVGGAPVTFTNSTPIDIPAGQPTTTSGPASPYPSNITVSGLTGNKLIKVTFNGFHHEFEDDVDMLLVGPGGQKFIMQSDAGGSTELLTPITYSLADSGTALLPDAAALVNGTTYRPGSFGTADTFVAPAPGAPYIEATTAGTGTFTSVFGTAAAGLNGTWSLYIVDDAGSDPGRIDNGWSLTFEANDYTCSVVTAADLNVSGRVLASAEGRGVTNARVTITDESGVSRSVITGRYGLYSFDNVEAGRTYVITVASRRFSFAPKVVQINDNISDLDFLPQE